MMFHYSFNLPSLMINDIEYKFMCLFGTRTNVLSALKINVYSAVAGPTVLNLFVSLYI